MSAMLAPGGAPQPSEPQTTVCITAVGDGTYTVSLQGDQEPQDPNMSPDAGDAPQTAQDIDSALDMAKQMLTGEATEEAPEPAGDGNAPLAPADAQAAWKQMAAAKSKKPMGM